MLNLIQNIDNSVNASFVNLVTNFPLLSPIASVITFFGNYKFIIPFALVFSLYFWYQEHFRIFGEFSRKYLFPFWTSIILAEGITLALKHIVNRAGPVGRSLLETDPSFPSGHATIAVAFFGILYYLFRKSIKSPQKKTIFFIFTHAMILLIGLSRLILNVHFLSDVLFGYFVGIIGLLCGVLVYTQLNAKK